MTLKKPSDHFLAFLRKKNAQFFILANEDYYEDEEHNTPDFYYVAFGYKKPGFIDDGWYLNKEDWVDWPDADEYGNSDNYSDEVSTLLSHPCFGSELYSCSYEVEEADLKEIQDYLVSLGLTEGKPGWMEADNG